MNTLGYGLNGGRKEPPENVPTFQAKLAREMVQGHMDLSAPPPALILALQQIITSLTKVMAV